MPVAPLQIPQIGAVSALDFSSLEKLGEQIKQGRLDQARREALSSYANGDPSALLASGDIKLADLYLQDQARKQAMARDQRDFAFRQQEASRSQANADRSYGLQVRTANRLDNPIPEGFDRSDDGTLAPIKGGPKDPAYIQSATKPRQLSVTDITKLSDEAGKYADLNQFATTFKPEYAGHTILGDTANVAGRYLPESVVGKNAAEGAAWWQSYDRYKNVVRNELFGAALTTQEKGEFDKADINPRMNSQQITANLARQKQVVENGLRRKANAMISSGYKPDTISKAYGLDNGQSLSPNSAVDWRYYFGGQ